MTGAGNRREMGTSSISYTKKISSFMQQWCSRASSWRKEFVARFIFDENSSGSPPTQYSIRAHVVSEAVFRGGMRSRQVGLRVADVRSAARPCQFSALNPPREVAAPAICCPAALFADR